MIESESSPSVGHREVAEIMIDPTTDCPETTISRMGKVRISAYVTEAAA